MLRYLRLLGGNKYACVALKRKIIIPEAITTQPFEQFTLVKTANYEFVIKRSQLKLKDLWVDEVDTPARVLLKQGLHLFGNTVPKGSIQEKFQAYNKIVNQRYQSAFEKCKTPNEIFHMSRRTKSDIYNIISNVGIIDGKYKHHLLFKSILEIKKQHTIAEYKKNGINIKQLGVVLQTEGEVFLPTDSLHLEAFAEYLNSFNKYQTVLDLCAGIGVLGFQAAKARKSSVLVSVDKNTHIAEPYKINSANLKLKQSTFIQYDICKSKDFQIKLKQAKAPTHFDFIICNPPWIVSNTHERESQIMDGIYDPKGQVLANSFKIAKKCLKDQSSRFVLIYSDLSQLLGLEKKSIADHCRQNDLIIVSTAAKKFRGSLAKKSALNEVKSRSELMLFEIKLA